ncbi:MAG: AAA family ATPase, partial [Pirellulales bacterium]
VEAIELAIREGYDVLIIDSLSHAWAGKGGILEFVDKAAKRTGNNFAGWRDATPKHNLLVESILAAPIHVICTLRSKVEHIVETVKGRSQVRKVGMQPVQRDGLEYEFTIVGDLTQEHDLIVTKTRAAFLADAVINKPGRKLGEQLHEWLDAGEAAPPPELVKKVQVNDAYQTAKDFLSNGATPEQRESARQKIQARQEDGTFSFEQATELLELCNRK